MQNIELVGFRVAQRPEVAGRSEDQVQGEHRHPLGDPAHRRSDGRADIAAAAGDLGGDQGEHPLTVGLSADQTRGADVGQSGVQPVEPAEGPVVREQSAVLGERLGVGDGVCAGTGVSDVGDERAAPRGTGRPGEFGVLPRGDRLFVDDRQAVSGEDPDSRAVGFPVALFPQTVRGVQQPEGRRHRFEPGVRVGSPKGREIRPAVLNCACRLRRRRRFRIVGTLWMSSIPSATRQCRPCQVFSEARE